jgi:hypothetical protein
LGSGCLSCRDIDPDLDAETFVKTKVGDAGQHTCR